MANSIRHNYRAILSYDPVTSKIGNYKLLGSYYIFRGDLLTTVFNKIRRASDLKREIIIGITLTNDLYQLSEQVGGYVKEDSTSLVGINRSALLRALSVQCERDKVEYSSYL